MEQNTTFRDALPDGLTEEEKDELAAIVAEIHAEEAAMRDAIRDKVNAIPVKYKKRPFFAFFKRLFDLLFSGILLILLSPVFLILAILIKCDDGGKVFYRHKRVGKNGKVLYIHKFRSMKRDADKLIGQLTKEQLRQYYTEFKIDDDPRITKIGKFLRKTSLDELPQIWDIFIGRLSLIGPRPLVERETGWYFDHREDLLRCKPGLTGYWQAYARNNVGYTDGKRQEMELLYVNKRSLWMDIRIFFKTIGAVLGKDGAQ